jgi:hypothetical protein
MQSVIGSLEVLGVFIGGALARCGLVLSGMAILALPGLLLAPVIRRVTALRERKVPWTRA